MCLLKKSFTPCDTEKRRAFDRIVTSCYKPLKSLGLLSLINHALNKTKCRNFLLYWDEQKSVKYVETSQVNARAQAEQPRQRRRRWRPVWYFPRNYLAVIKGWSRLTLSLTCCQSVFAEDPPEAENADASGGKKMTRDAENREMYTKSIGRGRPIKRARRGAA